MNAKAVYRPIMRRSSLFDNLIVHNMPDICVVVALVHSLFLYKAPSISPGTFMTKPRCLR